MDKKKDEIQRKYREQMRRRLNKKKKMAVHILLRLLLYSPSLS